MKPLDRLGPGVPRPGSCCVCPGSDADLTASPYSNGGAANDAPSPAESPPSPVPTPEMKPTAVPTTIPASHRNTATLSPLLDAGSGTSIATSTAPSLSDWARQHGALAGSPNLISIMGESPPTQPSSYEDQRVPSQPWVQQRPYANNFTPSSASPPTGPRRPLSFHTDAQFSASDFRSQASSPSGARRSSMHSPYLQARAGAHTPLPHQPQAHFYGPPELDFDLEPKPGLKAGERGYHFGFDTLQNPHVASHSNGNNVVLAGYEGGLDVYSVTKRGSELLTCLKGLRGGVYNAKILPWTSTTDHQALFPLIAVVIHGPVVTSMVPDSSAETQGDTKASPNLDGISTPQSDTNPRHTGGAKALPTIEAYQTTVEVYSLRTNSLICSLLQAPRIPVKTSVQNPIPKRLPPTGALQIHVDSGTVVIASGVTGECWLYRQAKGRPETGIAFRCLGKIWTSLQHAHRSDAAPEEDQPRHASAVRPSPQTPIVATRGRWLAYCPPAPSSQIALNAVVGFPVEGRPPGLATLTSPVLPSENLDVDQPISDGVMNRIMRETTQEVIQGARWVSKQGMQLWNNYWKQQNPQMPLRPPPVGSPPWRPTFSGRSDAAQFPPTYGVSGQAVTKDPSLISILDLETMDSMTSAHHTTTFKAPLGCSFLSFSPTGLSLFTASSKGDVQTVWDLMRIHHSKASALQTSQATGGHATRVRQIAQFSRMTVARIVDVAWTMPNGERAAMVTERGTVHLLDLPPSAFTWPPPRRRIVAPEQGAGAPENAPSAVSMASNALSSAYDAALPLINRRRRSSSNAQAASSLMDHASYGGKVLAAGISHSLGNAGTAINQLRQNGENRVSLPTSSVSPGHSCVTWITGRKHHALAVLGDGAVRVFATKVRKPPSAKDKHRPPRGNLYKDYKLKSLPDDVIAPTIRQLLSDLEEDVDLANAEFEGVNTLVLNPHPRLAGSDISPEASIPQAEIESSAPYQPFHTDRRVSLFEYDTTAPTTSVHGIMPLVDSATMEDSDMPVRSKSKKKRQATEQQPGPSGGTGQASVWAFGQAIKAVKVDVGLPPVIEDDISNSTDDHRALPASAMERVLEVGGNDEQIVVTTRRRRGGERALEDEDGFFEDDCDILDFADQRV